MREILFRGQRVDNKKWVEGTPVIYEGIDGTAARILYDARTDETGTACRHELVDPDTIGQYTGQDDMHGTKIFTGDIVRTYVDDDERRFVVEMKDVDRTVVVDNPDFSESTTRVRITGYAFGWQGYDLYPVVAEDGTSDVSRVEIIGNRWDNPELLEEAQDEKV